MAKKRKRYTEQKRMAILADIEQRGHDLAVEACGELGEGREADNARQVLFTTTSA